MTILVIGLNGPAGVGKTWLRQQVVNYAEWPRAIVATWSNKFIWEKIISNPYLAGEGLLPSEKSYTEFKNLHKVPGTNLTGREYIIEAGRLPNSRLYYAMSHIRQIKDILQNSIESYRCDMIICDNIANAEEARLFLSMLTLLNTQSLQNDIKLAGVLITIEGECASNAPNDPFRSVITDNPAPSFCQWFCVDNSNIALDLCKTLYYRA